MHSNTQKPLLDWLAEGRFIRKGKTMSSSSGLYGSDTGTNLLRTCMAELAGTYLLVLFGTGVAVTAILGQPIAGSPADSLAVALTFGLVLAALVTVLGPISGCHLNPAVTVALATAGKFPDLYVIPYIIAQMAGATLASITLWELKGDDARIIAALGATQPASGVSDWHVFFIELILTFLLMFIIMGVATNDRVPVAAAGVAVGFALAAAILFGGPMTGGAVNPARALGPMMVSGHMTGWYLYIGGPIVGAFLAALFYGKFLSKGTEPSEAEGQ